MDAGTAFAQLQQRALPAAWAADRRGSGQPHTVVALPSFSLDREVYEHYGDRVPALENRYLHCVLLARSADVQIVYLSSLPVPAEVLAGYLSLVAPAERSGVRRRLRMISPEDRSPRPLASKLLDRPDLLAQVREHAGGLALIEAWNVTEAERDLALALGLPVFGTAPELRALATKSNGRRLLRDAGVPVPPGVEDVHDAGEVAAAVVALRGAHDVSSGVVVKLDDSVAGDGNVVLPNTVLTGTEQQVRDEVAARLPDWYRTSLQAGGIVEQRIAGTDFRSPSCQADISPRGDVDVLATHEQRLGGPDGQVYEGCSCPADPAYAAALAGYTAATGDALAGAGAIGRFAVDFVVCRTDDGWALHALEINLRKGGTTHTMGLTRLLTGASYDMESGRLVDRAGEEVHYAATDNLVDPAWTGRAPADVRAALTSAGLAYADETGVGVVPHLLDCLAVDGRMGYTAIGRSPAQVADLERRLVAALA